MAEQTLSEAMWTVPKKRTPRLKSWASAKAKGTWGGYSQETRKWQGYGPSLPSRVNATHSLSPFPTRKWVNAAINSRPAHLPKRVYTDRPVTPPVTSPQPAADARRKWSPDELERVILDKIRERTSGGGGMLIKAFRIFNDKGGDGEITPAAFKKALEMMLQCELTDTETMDLFNKYDADGGGTIDVFEFMDGLMYDGPPKMTDPEANQLGGNRYCGGLKDPGIKPPPVPHFPVGMAGEIRNQPSSPVAPWPNPIFHPEQWNRHPNSHLLAHQGPQLKRLDQSPLAREPIHAMSTAACKGLLESESIVDPSLPRAAYFLGTTQSLRPLRNKMFAQNWDDAEEIVSFPFKSV